MALFSAPLTSHPSHTTEICNHCTDILTIYIFKDLSWRGWPQGLHRISFRQLLHLNKTHACLTAFKEIKCTLSIPGLKTFTFWNHFSVYLKMSLMPNKYNGFNQEIRLREENGATQQFARTHARREREKCVTVQIFCKLKQKLTSVDGLQTRACVK